MERKHVSPDVHHASTISSLVLFVIVVTLAVDFILGVVIVFSHLVILYDLLFVLLLARREAIVRVVVLPSG